MTLKELTDLYQKNKTLIAFALGALFILLFLGQCNRISTLKQEVVIAEENATREHNNYLASHDSVRTLKLTNGVLVASIRSFEFDLNKLKASEKALIAKYQKELGLNNKLENVNALLTADLEVKDSIILKLSQTKIDSVTTLVNFNSNDDFGNGNTRFVDGKIYIKRDPYTLDFTAYNPSLAIDQKIKLTAAIVETDGIQELKIGTSYPGLTISDIENINLINTKLNRTINKKAGWSIGPSVGVGFTLTPGQVVAFGPTIGFSAVWSPKWLRF
jgi:hypothetical protein